MTFFKNLRQRWITFATGRADLSYILGKADPKVSLAERIYWLEQLIGWIRSSTQVAHGFDTDSGQLHSVRIKFLVQLLDRQPEWKSKVGATIRSILIESSGVSLFSQIGLSQETGFLGEGLRRLSKKFLPDAPRESDLSQVFARVFTSPSDVHWVKNISTDLAQHIFAILIIDDENAGAELLKSIASDMIDAMYILASRVEALGLSLEIRSRVPQKRVSESPFFKLNRLIKSFGEMDALPDVITACRIEIAQVYDHIETSGVSVAVVFKLDTLETSLFRIEVLAQLLGKISADSQKKVVPLFLGDLVEENIKKNSVTELIVTQFHLLAKKIVERTGASGEHYIARDRKEWLEMFASAFGGGLITVLTTVNKYLIFRLELAFFFEGVFHWINYSGCFLAMQFLGFTLATKQPSATAPALAGKLKDTGKVDEFVNEVIRIIRSQFAAAVGNIGAVIPGCIIFGLLYRTVFHSEVLTEKEAHHIIQSLHPFKTLTILHGAVTGVVLWFSSIAGGWLENWVVFHRLPEALARNGNLNRLFGAEKCRKFANRCLHGTSSFGMNVVLGFLLAFVPVMAKFFGLPIEAKHVTLSSGALSFAVVSLPFELREAKSIGFACLGICFILVLNFGVSFILALVVAQRARQVESFRIRALLVAVKQRFIKHPFAFLFAPVTEK